MKCTEIKAAPHTLMAQAYYGRGINMSQELESSMQYLGGRGGEVFF